MTRHVHNKGDDSLVQFRKGRKIVKGDKQAALMLNKMAVQREAQQPAQCGTQGYQTK
jgi:hypothetical protein